MAEASVGSRRLLLNVIAISAIVGITVAVTDIVRGFRPGAAASSQVRTQSVTPTPVEPVSLAGANTKGDPRAQIAVIEFSDFQCPFCSSFARRTFPVIDEKYIRTGKVLFAFRNLPLEAIHLQARHAAEAAECASSGGRFWEMHDLLFAKAGHLDDSSITDSLRRVGIPQSECTAAAARARVDDDLAAAQGLSIRGTPTFLLGYLRDDRTVRVVKTLVGPSTAERFSVDVDALLAGAGR